MQTLNGEDGQIIATSNSLSIVSTIVKKNRKPNYYNIKFIIYCQYYI